ncbi:MAG: 6-carboxytetrahydropterin synthase [Phycisphaerales bacterium]|nr:6-carboxytetrahydropterin synthase [Phycisphaerales bacterium]
MRGLGTHYELDVRCRGGVNADTGYFLNIKDIDRAARASAIPLIERACHESPTIEPAEVLARVLNPLDAAVGGSLESIRWRLSPYYSVAMETLAPGFALMRQQFEFAASHRLHVPSLTGEQNRALFGKCNNPSGHGHNYRVEPCVRVPVRPGGHAGFVLADLERLTNELVISRFDHTNLNEDTAEFACAGGINPSVENIAKVLFGLLEPAIASQGCGASLQSITVWETDKTSCTYPG